MRADAWTRGDRPSLFSSSTERRGINPLANDVAQDARKRRDDPQSFTAAVGGLLSSRGWRQRAAMGAVFGEWERIVGADLAAHTKPESFDDGELVVSADSPAWATQVRLLAPDLLRRLGAELDHAAPASAADDRSRGPLCVDSALMTPWCRSGVVPMSRGRQIVWRRWPLGALYRRQCGMDVVGCTGRARHVPLSPQRVLVTPAKIDSGHAGKLPGSAAGMAARLVRARRARPDQGARPAPGGLSAPSEAGWSGIVLRCRVDHGP